jgi:hypothetical protein
MDIKAHRQGKECFHGLYLTPANDGRIPHYFGVSFITVPGFVAFVQ